MWPFCWQFSGIPQGETQSWHVFTLRQSPGCRSQLPSDARRVISSVLVPARPQSRCLWPEDRTSWKISLEQGSGLCANQKPRAGACIAQRSAGSCSFLFVAAVKAAKGRSITRNPSVANVNSKFCRGIVISLTTELTGKYLHALLNFKLSRRLGISKSSRLWLHPKQKER